MPDNDSRSDGDRFLPSVPARAEPYQLKGASGLDWGMQSRLARVFRPATGRTGGATPPSVRTVARWSRCRSPSHRCSWRGARTSSA